jgi:hypothetical protein
MMSMNLPKCLRQESAEDWGKDRRVEGFIHFEDNPQKHRKNSGDAAADNGSHPKTGNGLDNKSLDKEDNLNL